LLRGFMSDGPRQLRGLRVLCAKQFSRTEFTEYLEKAVECPFSITFVTMYKKGLLPLPSGRSDNSLPWSNQ